ncbi:MAG TPA: phosphoethanolamine--lipid A transferase [Albitalea sp.]|nr:phosphoethanolamine--lipid A transferase [Albitalea sp.]
MRRSDSLALPPAHARPPRPTWNPLTLAVLAALWMAAFANWPLWRAMAQLPEMASWRGMLFIVGFGVIVAALTLAATALLAWRWTVKPVIALLLVSAALAAHFMGTYGVVIDPTMMVNVLQTNPSETRDLLSLRLFGSVALLAGLPLWWLWHATLQPARFWPQLARNLAATGVALLVIAALVLALFADLSATMRNHKSLRYMINPLTAFFSLGVLATEAGATPAGPPLAIGRDAAALPRRAGEKPPLVLLVIGETARADHFSLNGYARATNPELAQRGVVSLRDVSSCGTSTAASLPCMFSHLGRKGFESRAQEHENLLDLLQHAGLAVLWLDNQAGCKGICARVEHAMASDAPPGGASDLAGLCSDGECFDEALLRGLDARIAALPEARRAKGVVLVLHQMGSHGPAYYKRSPPDRKPFKPECTTNVLQQCGRDALVNAYDNTIAYTDHVLAQTIDWLARQRTAYAPSLLYMSDHGESLGENNLFLHGLPFALAPREQTHVPAVLWLPPDGEPGRSLACLRERRDVAISHDNLFHTVLGLAAVTAAEYKPALDILSPCKAP